jgi:hypothetical protein
MPAAGGSNSWTRLSAALAALLAASLQCLADPPAALLRWVAPSCAAALALLLRCWDCVEGTRCDLRDALACQLVQHMRVEFRVQTQRQYHALLRSYRADPWAFQAAAVQPAYTAAGVVSWCAFYVLAPLLLWVVWSGGAPSSGQ